VPQKAIDGITKVNVYPIGNSSGAMADYREQWILLKSYSEYSEVAEPDHCHQVTFLWFCPRFLPYMAYFLNSDERKLLI